MCVDALASVLLTSRYPPSSHRASRELGSLHPVSFLGTSSFFSSTFTYDLNPFPLIRLRAHHRQHTPLASSPTSSSRVYTTQKTPTHKTSLRPSVLKRKSLWTRSLSRSFPYHNVVWVFIRGLCICRKCYCPRVTRAGTSI